MMPRSARILTTACPKPAVSLEDCQREYGWRLSLCFSAKIQVHRTVVIPILLYRKQIKLLGRVHQRCFRSILGMEWQDYVSDEEVRKKASLPSIDSILLQVQLRLAGHVSRTEDARMPKPVFFSELQNGKRDC